MENQDSLNRSIEGASKHYSSLFSLPSFKKALLLVAVICVFGVGLSTFALFRSMQGLADGLVLGFSLFGLTLVADLIVNKLLLRSDPIFSMRRTLLLSLFSWLFWLLFLVVGVALSYPFGFLLWVKLCLLGFGAIITLRIIVLMAISTETSWRKGLSVLLQPTLCLSAFVVFWTVVSSVNVLKILPFIVVSPIIGFVAVILFFSSIERISQKTSSMPSMNDLFRAFIVNWVTDQNAPLEKFLEGMGEDADIEVSLLKFDCSKPKASIIVPLVHPGPFKNIGSSLAAFASQAWI